MTGEAPARGHARRRRRRGFGGGPQNTPAEYKSGFGADGVKALQAFVKKGGTLVAFAQAGDLPVQRFGLPVRNIVAGVPSKEFWAPGSTLRVRFANTNPLAYGMPAEGLALFMAGSQVYEVTSTDRSQDVEILADLPGPRRPAERLAARRAGDRKEGRCRVGEARCGHGSC